MRKAFTLVEMLVVVAIIGILVAVLVPVFSGSGESARAATCLTNLRNLAAAAQTYAGSSGYFPLAGSCEYFNADTSSGKRNIKLRFYELQGWIAWNSQGAYAGGPTSSRASSSWDLSAYETSDIARDYALTNGVLWKIVSANRQVYQCPEHVRKNKTDTPFFSYVMNGYFGWTSSPGEDKYTSSTLPRIGYLGALRTDRRLLFAELPFNTEIDPQAANHTSSPGTTYDSILQYDGLDGYSGTPEEIGFNHKGKRSTYGHVAFADGHCEKLTYPEKGMSVSERQELTKWLCTATDISYSHSRYQKLTYDNE